MTRHDRRRLHLVQRELEQLPPSVRAILQVGAKIEGTRVRRSAFLFGVWLGVVIGLLLAIALVRFGATEVRR